MPITPMKFQQKHMATQTALSFEESTLEFSVKDNNGAVDFEVEYGSIPAKTRLFFERNNWLRNVGALWCALGAVQIALAIMAGSLSIGAAFWLIIGLICLGAYRAMWAEYEIFDTDEGSIWVLKDAQHEQIIKEIQDRRVAQLQAWFDNTDFEDDPSREIQSVEWMVKQKGFTRAEADQRIAEIEARSKTLSIPHRPGHDNKLH